MAIDFNAAEEQREPVYGPVPAGSRVLLSMELMKPKNESQQMPFVAVSKNKLYMLWVRFTVVSGTYQGFKWSENWMLPEGVQRIQLTEKQKMACRISYSRMRSVVEAARGINPQDKSPQANSRRVLNDWLDLNGMRFPARVGIKDDGHEYNGRIYWDNQVQRIITPDNPEYRELVAGGEFINKGGAVQGRNAPQASGNGGYDDYGSYDDYSTPPPSADDPF